MTRVGEGRERITFGHLFTILPLWPRVQPFKLFLIQLVRNAYTTSHVFRAYPMLSYFTPTSSLPHPVCSFTAY